MNTNALKTFAKAARDILLPNVNQRLRYWGFDEKGNNSETIMIVQGGYLFRGEIYTDVTVPAKLERLTIKLRNAQSFKDIREEAAYTWFNRLMAIKILEKNGYNSPILAYVEGTTTPFLLQNAQRGNYSFVAKNVQPLLRTYLESSQDEEAFALLLTHYCNDHQVLSTVFGKINDYTEILTPMNLLASNGLVQHLNTTDAITDADYKEVELIGWLYQFYISDRKDEVFANFKKKKKARAEDIPAATQIFTPKWIVQYMVENTLGKLYLDYEPDAKKVRESLKYLVESTETDNETLIENIEDLRILDPACGSGHILVVAFDLLMKAYSEEGINSRTAAEKILTKHLYGLDIDDRAAQLANFAVRLKAAQYDKTLLTKAIVVPILAFPEAMDFDAEDVAFYLGDTAQALTMKVENALHLLQQGKNLGAVIQLDFTIEEQRLLQIQWQLLNDNYHAQQLSFTEIQRFQRLQPFIEVLLILTDRFPAVVANPPYMGGGSMNADLKAYLERNYPISKSDLFAVFMEVTLNWLSPNGLISMINQQSWMFLSSYEKLRKAILANNGIQSMLHLGARTFDELSGEVVQSTAFVMQNAPLEKGTYYRLIDYRNSTAKKDAFLNRQNEHSNIAQNNFAKISGSPIAYWVSEKVYNIFSSKNFEDYAILKQGLATGDNSRFLRFWYEIAIIDIEFKNKEYRREISSYNEKKWVPYSKGGAAKKWYGNNDYVVYWYNNGQVIRTFKDDKGNERSRFRGASHYFKKAITWSLTSSNLGFAARFRPEGSVFDINGMSAFTHENLFYILGILNSKVNDTILSIINPTLAFQVGDLRKAPIIINNDSDVETYTKTNIEISKIDWDSRETSWDFEESPLVAVGGLSLSDSYRDWVAAVTDAFYQLHENEEELNRIFIDIYGLQDELTPDVLLKDITILQEELDRKALAQCNIGDALPIDKREVVRQLVSYCIGCAMGRYRLDKKGLQIAHQHPTAAETAAYTFENIAGETQAFAIDEDGILPLIGQQSPFPDDMVKLVTEIVEKVWGKDSITTNLNFINEALGQSLEDYLSNPKKGFWKHHTQKYNKRPIYWLFASSPKGQPAFQVIAYLHRMDKYTIQKIRTRYLHPYQAYLSESIKKAEQDTFIPPRELDKLKQAEIECRSYDETLKSLEKNIQIELDLDNGVLENYQLFGEGVYKI